MRNLKYVWAAAVCAMFVWSLAAPKPTWSADQNDKTVKQKKQTKTEVKSKAEAEAKTKVNAKTVKKDKAGQPKVSSSVRGKIVVVGPDGQKREIEFGDGDNKVAVDVDSDAQISGKIVVVGPDGEKKEYNFGDGADVDIEGLKRRLRERIGAVGKLPRPVIEARSLFAGKFVLGVHCVPVSETVRAQLNLDHGLAVRAVFDATPAAEAGLKPHDVLLQVGDNKLVTVADLLETVQKAGEEKMTLTYLRGGEKKTVDVTPVKREAAKFADKRLKAIHEQLRKQLEGLEIDIEGKGWLDRLDIDIDKPGLELKLKEWDAQQLEQLFKRFQGAAGGLPVGPIVPGDTEATKRLEEKLEELSRQLKQLHEDVDKLKSGKNKENKEKVEQ